MKTLNIIALTLCLISCGLRANDDATEYEKHIHLIKLNTDMTNLLLTKYYALAGVESPDKPLTHKLGDFSVGLGMFMFNAGCIRIAAKKHLASKNFSIDYSYVSTATMMAGGVGLIMLGGALNLSNPDTHENS